MDKRQTPIAILNLTGELAAELAGYFSARKMLVVNPLDNDKKHDWSHILVKDIHDFSLINKTYEISVKDRHIISLSQVDDLQNFTVNNGNLIIDDCWFKGPMGNFIMDKYFQSHGGISLADNYPAFTEIGSFNVANPFNTGEYLDRMVQKAFESGAGALNVKTFFDHLVMYVTGLKNKGKAGLPFEVTYGVFEDIFAVQLHFFSNQLNVMDVATSLSSSMSKKAEEYYLNVAVQAADFFDFSYMPQVNKVIVTALWTKDERVKFENRGLMFSALVGGLPLAQYKNEGATSSLVASSSEIEDFSDKINIPDGLSDDNSASLIKGFTEDGQKSTIVKAAPLTEDEKFSQVVSGGEDEDPFSQTISGGEEEDPFSQVVKGSEEEDEFKTILEGGPQTKDEVQLIKGGSLLEELAQTVKGKFEEDKSVIKISGNKIDVDKVAYTIASNIDETTKEKNLKVRSLGNALPQSIKTGLFDFAKGLNKEVDNLDDGDLDRFQLQKVPEIIKKELLKQTTANAQNSQAVVPASEFKTLEAKLQAANSDNEKLKNQLKNMVAEVRILKDSRNKLAEIQMKAKQAAAEAPSKVDDDEALRKQFQQKLLEQKTLNEMELKKLGGLLERETTLIEDLKQEEMRGRKLQLEATKKEAFFAQELEKAERLVKGKDLILIKTKETLTKLIEKKDKDILDLKIKVDQMGKVAASNASVNYAQTIKDLEKQNQNFVKQIEGYKNKITTLTTNLAPTKTEEEFKDDARKLHMQHQQMKNQLDVAKKEIEKLHAKASLEASQMSQLRLEKMKAEELLKKAQAETKAATAAPVVHQANDAEFKRLQAHSQILETQLKDTSAKIVVLESKITELSKPAKAVAGEDNSKVKQNQLENSVKKLTQDLLDNKNQLAEAKKETNKLRQEKTALQNQLDKLKKEADKAKPATPKKPGGKAA